MLRALPGVFCAGEMLDWEAPTGGYLLTRLLRQRPCRGPGRARLAGPARHGLKEGDTDLLQARSSAVARLQGAPRYRSLPQPTAQVPVSPETATR